VLIGVHLVYLIGIDALFNSCVILEADESIFQGFSWSEGEDLRGLSESVSFLVQAGWAYSEGPGPFYTG
jgi:hypothetical protein